MGGGIHNAGTLVLMRSTVEGNTGIVGGGIVNNFGTMTLADSSVSRNTSTDNGGGVFTAGGGSHFTNVTISGNRSEANGGGIFKTGGALTMVNGTIVGNVAQNVASGFSGSASMQHTIVAANSDSNCSGAVTTLGHNLEDTDTCGFTGMGDLPNRDPLSSAPSRTMAGLSRPTRSCPAVPPSMPARTTPAPRRTRAGCPGRWTP
jgi:hypothetical protein